MDLQQEYNNVKIKKGNKQKTVFSMPEGAFEPTVMFFRLTNLLAMFQVMMNNLLRNMIERREVVVFIDDMIIVTETKKGHSEIVKEVLRRIEENNLFVKLEKYM